MVKILTKRDQECGRALQCRTSLLRVFDRSSPAVVLGEAAQLSFVQRLLSYASPVKLQLRFFHPGSGMANPILRKLTEEMLLSQSFGARVAKLSISVNTSLYNLNPGDWFLVEFDKSTISFLHLSISEHEELDSTEESSIAFRVITLLTVGISDVSSPTEACRTLWTSI